MLTFPPDISFVIQIASFLVLWFGLKRLLFDPVLHVIEQREARTTGTQREAAAMKAAADAAATEYERRIFEVRQAVAAETEAARRAIQTEERNVLAQAREQVTLQLGQLRDSLGRQAQAARAGLADEAQTLASEMVERVVGRPLS